MVKQRHQHGGANPTPSVASAATSVAEQAGLERQARAAALDSGAPESEPEPEPEPAGHTQQAAWSLDSASDAACALSSAPQPGFASWGDAVILQSAKLLVREPS